MSTLPSSSSVAVCCARVLARLPVSEKPDDRSSVAGELVTLAPSPSVTTTVKAVPPSASTVAGVVYEHDVAPRMGTPSFRHW